MYNKIIPLRRVAKHKKRRLQRRIAEFATQIPTQHLDNAKIWGRGIGSTIYGKPSWLEELRTEWGTKPVTRPAWPAFREIEIKLADTDDLQNIHLSPAEEEGWKKLAATTAATYRIIWKGLDEERFKNEYLNIPPQ